MLQKLRLRGNRLTSIEHLGLHCMPGLRVLDLRENMARGRRVLLRAGAAARVLWLSLKPCLAQLHLSKEKYRTTTFDVCVACFASRGAG